jgi:esterase/lipase superfamily enzyme
MAVLDMWRAMNEGEVGSSTLGSRAISASVASLGAATSLLSPESDGANEIVSKSRERIEANLDPGSLWYKIWKKSSEIGQRIGFLLDSEAARADKLWDALIAFAAEDERVELGTAPEDIWDSLTLVDARIRATSMADLAAIRSGLGVVQSSHEGGQTSIRPPVDSILWDAAATKGWAELDPADLADGAKRINVWFGTNREPYSRADPESGYSAALADQLFYGVCRLNVPRQEDLTGGLLPFISAWLRRGTPAGRLTVERYLRFDHRDDFIAQLQFELAQAGSERTGLVYVHGYANSFSDAAAAAARISLAVKHRGPTAMFSWASKGRRSAYRHDERVVEHSRDHLIEFLETICERAGLEHVDLVVHSLGNRLLLRSLVDWFTNSAPASVPLRNVFLGAPDVDQPEFVRHSKIYAAAAMKTTLYGSNSDSALLASRVIHGGVNRVGLMPPVITTADIDTIETSKVDLSRIRHAYIIDASAIRADIHSVQNGTHDPALRANLQAASSGLIPDFWRMT